MCKIWVKPDAYVYLCPYVYKYADIHTQTQFITISTYEYQHIQEHHKNTIFLFPPIGFRDSGGVCTYVGISVTKETEV